MNDDLHRLAELRSLAYHRAVAERLREDPTLLDAARERLERWARLGQMHEAYAAQWRSALSDSTVLHELLTADTEPARAARQCTPFPGALPSRQRHAIWRDVRQRWEASR